MCTRRTGFFLPNFVFEITRRRKAIAIAEILEIYIWTIWSEKYLTSKIRATIPATTVNLARA